MLEVKARLSKIDREKVFFVSSYPELTNLHNTIDSMTTKYGGSADVGAFCLRNSLENFEFQNRPVHVGSIFLVKPSRNAPRSERVEFGSFVVHEITHSNGGKEVEAYIAQREYLRRFGLSGPSDFQILKIISSGYQPLSQLHAYKHFFGTFPVFRRWSLPKLVHSVRELCIRLTPEYDFKKDWCTTNKSSGK